jgi:ATPase subunit of ABC transporter with duplicated ATPase domains
MNMNCVELMQSRFPSKNFFKLSLIDKTSSSFCLKLDRPLEEYRAELGKFGVSGDMALQSIVSLSGGQKSRVAFALLSILKYNHNKKQYL